MMSALLVDAQSGGLDGQLLTTNHFYQTDYTKPLMLMEDGACSPTAPRPSTCSVASGG